MGELLTNFGGQCARTRCFLHITNLTAKSLLNEFDVKGHDDLESADVDERKLLEFAKQLEDELDDARRDAGEEVVRENGREDEEDDDESWVDEVASLSPEEQEEFNKEVRPVKLVLLKIRRLAFKIVHSTTVILPAWRDILKEKSLPDRLIPRDVKTRWNSTYDMLNVAVQYRPAVDALCNNREHRL
ncbi:hypothetical protein C2E23DRAFT_739549, partial [Lenzites betulinus]